MARLPRWQDPGAWYDDPNIRITRGGEECPIVFEGGGERFHRNVWLRRVAKRRKAVVVCHKEVGAPANGIEDANCPALTPQDRNLEPGTWAKCLPTTAKPS